MKKKIAVIALIMTVMFTFIGCVSTSKTTTADTTRSLFYFCVPNE